MPRTALVIDDDPINRKLACAMFRKLGWQVSDADSGPNGLAFLRQHSAIDAVLLDISMPQMTGLEVCKQIRGDDALAPLLVIAYTAHAMPQERNQFIAAGFDDILIKPITLQMLSDMLQQYLAEP